MTVLGLVTAEVCVVERVTSHTAQDPDAWQRGFEAGESGRPCGACPYPAESVKAFSWYAGWLEGKAEHAGVGCMLG